MHCRLLTQCAIIMVQFLGGLRKINLHSGPTRFDYLCYVVCLGVLACNLRLSKSASISKRASF